MLVIYFRKKYFIRRVNSETKLGHFDVITKTEMLGVAGTTDKCEKN